MIKNIRSQHLSLLVLLIYAGLLCSFDSYPHETNAVKLTSKNPYGLSHTVNEFHEEDYFRISVWRYKGDEDGVLVVDGIGDKEFYYRQNKASVVNLDGWQLLRLDIFIPPLPKFNALKVYVWNKGKNTIYFNDLTIEKIEEKTYPSYNEEALNIIINPKNFQILKNSRLEAYKRGSIESRYNEYAKAKLIFGTDTMKCNIRLKGDYLEHATGNKWSFRIKLNKKYSWKGMRSFSIQSPVARDFLNEWIAHKLFEYNDILATRYGFIPVKINGKSMGFYAFEEHFDKHLIEYNNRREGPIVKLSEDALWENYRLKKAEIVKLGIPYFRASAIEPFKKNRTVETKKLFDQFLIAQNLLSQYKYIMKAAPQIFDIDKCARFFALIDLTMGYHSINWHNTRYYFNPVICKLEPIGFDCYTSSGITSYAKAQILGDFSNKNTDQHITSIYLELFNNKEFAERYLHYLEIFSDQDTLNAFYSSVRGEIHELENKIIREFPYYKYDTTFLLNNGRIIKRQIPSYKRRVNNDNYYKKFNYFENKTDSILPDESLPYLVKAYLERKNLNDNTAVIKVANYSSRTLSPVGFSSTESKIEYELNPEMQSKKINNNDSANIELKNFEDSIKYIFFHTEIDSCLFSIEIYPWRIPFNYSPEQELHENNIEKSNIFEIVNKDIIIKEGTHILKNTIIVPGGYNVIFQPGSKLNIINGAAFISYSPVFIKGTLSDPVIIYSKDGTAMGFSVFQAQEKSILENLIIDQLNTIDYNGWTLTGAVNFYESDVDLSNVTIKNNRCEDALNIIRSEFTITNCTFDNIYGDAIDSDFSNGILKDSHFKDIANDAIDFSGSNAVIEDCKIINASDKGISCGEKSELIVRNIEINNTNIAFASKDLSKMTISNSRVSNSNYCFVAFKKKPEYGKAEIYSVHNSLKNIMNYHLIEKGSKLFIDNKEIPGIQKNVARKFYIN